MVVYIIIAIVLAITVWIITKLPCCRNKRGELDINEIIAKRRKPSVIPQHEIESVANCLLPAMQAFFESEDGRREWEAWRAAELEREGVRKKVDKSGL